MDKDAGSKLKLIAAFAAVYIIWGSTYLGIKFAIETIPPFLMAGIRFLLAGSILFLIAYPKTEEKINFTHVKSTGIIGLLLLLGGNGGVVWAEQFVPSGLTALLISTVPVWVVVITLFLPKKEKTNSLKNTFGVLLGFAGLFFLVSPESLIKGDSIHTTGAAVLIFATLSWSAGSVYTKHAVLPKSSLVSTALEMIIGGAGLLIVSLLFGEWSKFSFASVSSLSFLSFLYLVLFGSLVAFTAYIWLLHKAGPSKATTYAYVNPVVAVFLGWLLAGEQLTFKIIISAVIIIAAVVIIITDFSSFRKGKNRENKS